MHPRTLLLRLPHRPDHCILRRTQRTLPPRLRIRSAARLRNGIQAHAVRDERAASLGVLAPRGRIDAALVKAVPAQKVDGRQIEREPAGGASRRVERLGLGGESGDFFLLLVCFSAVVCREAAVLAESAWIVNRGGRVPLRFLGAPFQWFGPGRL
jgi:hypothetical protein